MFEVGTVCLKIAGRDAGKKCVVVDVLEDNYVIIDGATRRRKCNIVHLEPLGQSVELKKNASHEDVAAALKELGIEVKTTKPKQKAEKPKVVKAAKAKPEPKKKPAKKETAEKRQAKAEEKKESPKAEKAPKASPKKTE